MIPVRDVLVVLNAFRHQIGSHRLFRGDVLQPRGVLNAFRHQIGSHRFQETNFVRYYKCSTPSGI